jgi:mannose-6-phosphate isomerase-like protein (cupin superfamily)
MNEFITPPNHFGFQAKKIYGNPIEGCITDCSVAYIAPNGGGPRPSHVHPHHHFFIVTEGEATIYIAQDIFHVKKDEAIFVNGNLQHSIWNEKTTELKMIGITITTK